jgi:hypothetical protein
MATLSPFDAGSVQPWVIWRRIGIEDGAAVDCGTRPSFFNFCEDEFVVQSITRLSRREPKRRGWLRSGAAS